MSTDKFDRIRKRQHLQLLSQFLVGVAILLFVGLLAFNSFNLEDPNSNRLGSQTVNSENSLIDLGAICISDEIHPELIAQIKKAIPERVVEVQGKLRDEFCKSHIGRNVVDTNSYLSLWRMPFVFVTRHDSAINNIDTSLLQSSIQSRFYQQYPILWSEQSDKFLNSRYSSEWSSNILDNEELIEELIQNRDTVGILPLGSVDPRLKILPMDSISVYDTSFSIFTYPLTDYIWVSSDSTDSDRELISEAIAEWQPYNSFESNQIDTILLTGRSAVGSQLHYLQLRDDPNYNPLINIADTLLNSTISHLSNESSFATNCVQNNTSTILCGSDTSFQWITSAGFDIVSLTGPSILDYGRPTFEQTLTLYDDASIKYFAGGRNRAEAQSPAKIVTDSGSYLFFGYSLTTPTRYLATERASGNVAPDSSGGDGRIISDLLDKYRADTSLKIVEMQWGTSRDQTKNLTMDIYSKIASDKGADVIFGTTALRPLSIEFIESTPVFYGLGSFLHTGVTSTEVEVTGILVKLLLYSGNLVSFELIPVGLDNEYRIEIKDMDTVREIMNTIYNID